MITQFLSSKLITVEPLHNGHLGAEERGCCGEVAIVERFKQESMHGLSAIKSGHCREAAIVDRWSLVEV